MHGGTPAATTAPTTDKIHALAHDIRAHGILAVTSRHLADAVPAGLDILAALPVLLRETAAQWRLGADALDVGDRDRVTLSAAASLLEDGSLRAESVHHQLNTAALSRAVGLSSRAGGTSSQSLAKSLTAVLDDMQQWAGAGRGEKIDVPQVYLAKSPMLPTNVVPVALTGALTGVLRPWLPPPSTDPHADCAGMRDIVHYIARQDALATLSHVANAVATLAVATAFATALDRGSAEHTTALVFSDHVMGDVISELLAYTPLPRTTTASITRRDQGTSSAVGETTESSEPGSTHDEETVAVTNNTSSKAAGCTAIADTPDASNAASVAGASPVPSWPRVREDIGETDEDEQDLTTWDILMGSRRPLG